MEPEIPLMGVDVGVRGGELVPSNQVSLLKICRLAPESKTQRDDVELSVSNLIVLICVSLLSLSSLWTSQSCFVGYPRALRTLHRSIPLHPVRRARWILQRKFNTLLTVARHGMAFDRIPAIIGISWPDR